MARFPTRPNGKYCTIRLPWALFRPEVEGSPVLEPSAVTHISLRYELRRTPQAPAVTGLPQQLQQQQPVAAVAQQAGAMQEVEQQPRGQLFVPEGARLPTGADAGLRARSMQLQQQRAAQAEQRFSRFSIEVDWIKALPAGSEPEFVLVSCAGSANLPGMDGEDLARMIAAKRKGEESLRASGLGYTIIRPGPLVVSCLFVCLFARWCSGVRACWCVVLALARLAVYCRRSACQCVVGICHASPCLPHKPIRLTHHSPTVSLPHHVTTPPRNLQHSHNNNRTSLAATRRSCLTRETASARV